LAGFPQTKAVKTLQDWSRSPRPDLRRQAIASLGRIATDAAVQPLLQALAAAANDGERQTIVAALARHGAKTAQKPLSKLLETTNNPRLRAQIAIALGTIPDGDVGSTLIGLLNDPTPAVRFFAIQSLREQGQRQAVTPLTERALAIEQGLRKQNAQQRVANVFQTLAELSEETALLRTLADPVAETRRQAALALGYLVDEQARTALQRVSREDNAAAVREAAAFALQLLER
jgi:HEAT repeat protein